MIDARTNHNLWGDQYDRKMSDLLSVQQDITGAISAKLRERLSAEPKKEIAKGGTNDPEAYQLYLKGRYYWGKRTSESLEKSKEYFNQAIQRDPNYAQAYVGLADYYNVVSDYSPVPESEAAVGARTAAEKALALDGSLAEAHNALAASHWARLEFADAEREFQRALEINPNYANAHHWYGQFLSWDARPTEGISHLRRAVELDPLNMQYNTNLGQAFGNARQYDASVEQLKKTLEMDPNYAQAVSRIEMRKQLANHRYVDPADIAYDYAALGDKEQTFAWLDKAAAEKSGGLEVIKVVPAMDPWRSDPRYLDLLKRIGMRP